MGSRDSLSNGREPEEVTDLVEAFQEQNKCVIILGSSLALHNGKQDSLWSATALEIISAGQEQQPLVLASATVWGGDYKTLMGVVSRLLYTLDFELALREYGNLGTKKA